MVPRDSKNYTSDPDRTCPVCGRDGWDDALHIGKRSKGWFFFFEAHDDPRIRSVADYRDYLKDRIIVSENGEEMTPDEFFAMVDEWNAPNDDGTPKQSHEDPMKEWSFPFWVDDEGYEFTDNPFS